MIIDAHSHLGWSDVFSAGITEELLLGTMAANGIDATLVMPAAGADPVPTHDAIAELAEREAGRVFGMASIPPLLGEDFYVRELRRCVNELGFKAVKLHPQAHATSPVLPVADVVFRTAAELGIPVMVHTGTGAPFALPSLLIRRARQYPELKIVLAHAGFAVYTEEAIIAAEVCENVYLEPSWCLAGDIGRMIRLLGPERVMYGGDLPYNVPVELTKPRAAGLGDDETEWFLWRTARDVFGLPIPDLPTNTSGGDR
jgi:predicted TIM-barrel fold metal-dependent hydrolase